MEVFLVTILRAPTQKQEYDEGAVPEIVVQPQAIVAKDEQQAALRAMKFVPEEAAKKPELLEVRILPFRHAS